MAVKMEAHETVGSAPATPGLEQCLELLRGPQDEKRFVGLLLATKLLPAGNKEVLTAVSSAVGFRFLTRLLLPLRSHQVAVGNEEEREKSAAAAGLGLAVLSSLCRVEELASCEEVMQHIPLFVKVVRAGGVTPILQPSQQHKSLTASDSSAISDALECLLQVGAASSEGKAIAVESGCLRATAQALQIGIASRQPWQILAVQLLVSVLEGPQRSELLAEDPQVFVDAIPVLAQMLVPHTQQQDPSGSQQPAPDAAGDRQAAGLGSLDSAALQLEAMQALLILLPLPMPQAQAAAVMLQAMADDGDSWAAKARSGLYSVLASRTGTEQRHAALRLAAAMLELVPSTWLTGPAPPLAVAQGSFFQLITELVKVETGLLMNDAVALLDSRTQGPGEHAEDSADFIKNQRGTPGALYAAFHDQADATGSSNVPSNGRPEAELGTATSSHSTEQQLPSTEGIQATSDGSRRGACKSSNQAAARRVAEVLPAVLALLEECLNVLSANAEAAESDGSSSGAVLDNRIAQQAMQALSEAAETLLQYLERAAAEPSTEDSSLTLAVIRTFARFMADVPYAHSVRIQAIMPFLVHAHHGQAVQFLLPGLLQCTEPSNLEVQAPEAIQQWRKCLQQPQVLPALAQLVVKCVEALQQAEQSIQQQQPPTADHAPHNPPQAEAALATACELLNNIIAPPSSLQAAIPISPQALQAMKPGVDAVAAWSISHAALATSPSSIRLVSVLGLLCVSSLHANNTSTSSSASAQTATKSGWSASECESMFDVVLRSLSGTWASSHDVAASNHRPDALTGTLEWEATLDAATSLVERSISIKSQALTSSWVQQCMKLDQRELDVPLAFFLQACMK